jgi:hypothetical protein
MQMQSLQSWTPMSGWRSQWSRMRGGYSVTRSGHHSIPGKRSERSGIPERWHSNDDDVREE